jgi:hypothetical protein
MADGAGPEHADQVIILPYRGYGTRDKLVTRKPSRLSALQRLAAALAPTGCPLVVAGDAQEAARHAAAQGLIQASDLRAVRSALRVELASAAKAGASRGSLK